MNYRSTLFGCLLAVTAIGAATGCSGDNGSGTADESRSVSSPAATEGVPASEGVETPGPPPPLKVAAGDEFVRYDDSDGDRVEIQVTADKFRCGIKRYPFAASSVSGSIPADVPAVPSAGQQFCQADLSVKNVGKRPLKDGAQPGADASISVGDAQYAATDLSEAIVYTFLSNANNSGKNVGWFLGDVINPGEVVQQIQVWEVPAEAKPIAIVFASQQEEAGETAAVEVRVP